MSLNKSELSKKLQEAASGGMPSCAAKLSSAIKSYCEGNGTPVKGIKVTLLPCSGAGWSTLASQATSSGVGPQIISVGLAAECSASMTTIPTEHGPQQIPSSFNTGANVGDLSNCESSEEVWDKIAEAIINFMKPELA
ncbi:hypothetical protein J6W34_00095 [bacterium]|nr:hypothetical protein [bacterium]